MILVLLFIIFMVIYQKTNESLNYYDNEHIVDVYGYFEDCDNYFEE